MSHEQIGKLIKNHIKYVNRFELAGMWISDMGGEQYYDPKGIMIPEGEVKTRIDAHLKKTTNAIMKLT